MNRNRLLEVLPRLPGKRILVVGDLFLDEYLTGRPTRLSREAPIPVLEFTRRFALPGGGSNPARNLQSLGAEALMVGVVGNDDAGVELRGLLEAAGVHTEGVVVDPDRATITKTRILSHGDSMVRHQVARIDRLPRGPVHEAAMALLVRHLEGAFGQVDAVLLSDYKGGVVTCEVVEECRRLSRRHNTLLTVDSQGDLQLFKGFGLVKANQKDTQAALGHALDSEEDFEAACRQLLADLGACVVLITRGADGMSMMAEGGRYVRIPVANRSEVFDVTGAGDTAIAVVTLALAAGARPEVAAHLANYAAGLVVRKIGNATTTIEELRETITSSQFPRVDPEQDLLQSPVGNAVVSGE